MRAWQRHGCTDHPFLSTELLVVEAAKEAPRLGPWERVRARDASRWACSFVTNRVSFAHFQPDHMLDSV